MEKTIEGKAAVGLQPGTVGGQASQEIGKISAIVAALHDLVRPRTRKKVAVEARAERVRRPPHSVSRSPLDAGITGGLSLFLDNPNPRRR